MHAWFRVGCLVVCMAGVAGAQEVKPITVLQDASPAIYGRSAKVKATVLAIDLATREVTLKGVKGRPLTLRVEARVRNLAEIQVGDEVTVRYHEPVGLALRKIAAEDPRPPTNEAGGGEMATGATAVAARQMTLVAEVDAVHAKEKTVTLKGPDGSYLDLYVRAPEVLQALAAGDRVVATYTEASAVSVEKPKPRKKK